MIKSYIQVTTAVKGLSEQLDLEKYYDVYDITDFDISDAMQGFPEDATEEAESLRVLKIAAARFHTIRKLLLCALLAFEATGDNSDFVRWSTAAQCLNQLSSLTGDCYERLRLLLSDEESMLSHPFSPATMKSNKNRLPRHPRNQVPSFPQPRKATNAIPQAQLSIDGHPRSPSQAGTVA